jgi:polysaccharide biosynthesis/export protein ExoF
MGQQIDCRSRIAPGALFVPLVILAGIVCNWPAFAGSDLVLGPGDKIAISVYKRPDLSGEFRVLPAGYLSLPFVPNLPVIGMTLTEVKQALTKRFREDAFLLDPRVNVDLIETRPIFVAGDVRRPGTVPYQMGMTVLHAVAAAGGVRVVDVETLSARLEIGRLREKLRTSQQTIGLALIRRARLMAERGDRFDFELPDQARSYLTEVEARKAYESEQVLLRQRGDAHRLQLELLEKQTGSFKEEIEALQAQSEAKTRESNLVDEERRYVESLMQRGLTARSGRNIELQRAVVQIEGEKRQLASLIAKAKQEIGRIEQSIANLKNQREIEISSQLRETDDGIDSLRIAIEETQASLAEAGEVLPRSGPVVPRSPAEFEIVRNDGEMTVRFAATADTSLLPGDLVDVPKP